MKKKEVRKLLFALILGVFLISLVSAYDLGGYDLGGVEQDGCVDLYVSDADSTYANFTSMKYPNQTIEYYNLAMTQNGYDFTYNFCNTSQNGEYFYTVCGDPVGKDPCKSFDFLVTPNGEIPDNSKIGVYLLSVFVILMFLGFAIFGIFKSENYVAQFALYWISHLLFVALSFMLWNGSLNFLTGHAFVIGFFRILWWVAMISMFPMLILSAVWMFYTHVVTKEMEKLINGGMSPEEAFTRTKRRKGGLFGK